MIRTSFFLKKNAESLLSKIILPSNRKEIHTVAEGSAVLWQNCFDPKRKDIHDIEYVRETFMDALKKSNEKANGKRKNYH